MATLASRLAARFTLALGALLLAAAPAAAQEPEPVEPAEPGAHHAPAEPRSPAERLDALFRTLAEAPPPEAARLEQEIARLWSASGSDSMDLLLARGRKAMDDEAWDKAIDHLTALVTLAPEFAEGWNARATLHFLRDDYWAAVSDIEQVLALEPRHFGALTGLGAILERTGDEAGALRALREALRVHPHLESAREAVGRLAPKVDGRDI